jgi:predicted acylesterase/phospholipase RssA
MDGSKDQLRNRFRNVLKGSDKTFIELVSLGQGLQRANQLDDARRLFEIALFELSTNSDQEVQTKLFRDLLLCTYKDPDLPAETRLQNAEQMVSTVLGEPPGAKAEPPSPTLMGLAETLDQFPKLKQDLLGVAGAIQKRRWDTYGQRSYLVRSYQYYLRGYEMGSHNDRGYNAINLAFVLDLLGEQEEGEIDHGRAVREMASKVRKEIVAILDPTYKVEDETTHPKLTDPGLMADWWVLVTLGEAWLGLGDYTKSKHWMTAAAKLKAQLDEDPHETKHLAPWQLETAVRQIAQLARIRARRDGIRRDALQTSPGWDVLRALLGGDSEAADSFLRGKIGLALSGGGFRASLFHIGVLAKLAEFDVLRHVEVLSCVSGGSILGTYYYLELRKMLQEKIDGEVTRQDYIDLVKRIYTGFLAGVQSNIRLRMLFGWSSNAKVLTRKRSSTSDRLADLYEDELYARVEDGEQDKPRYLADLRVAPLAEAPGENGATQRVPETSFNPKYDNWNRHNKVPVLILNATTLNTCHNWQFTASFMGEPPARAIDVEIDANHRLRRMYHSEAPGPYRRPPEKPHPSSGVRLGEAVAASACVPGLFTPVLLEDLYGTLGTNSDDYLTRLVDGGNYDNQGIASLREQDCTVLIISDACGQTGMSLEPAAGHIGVSKRANDILMSRVREAQYQLLSSLTDADALQGVMYLHLKKGLRGQVVDWAHCEDPSKYKEPLPKTDYGIREDVQRLLASIRTDLDSFSWLESDALMTSAYHMTGVEWDKRLSTVQKSSDPPVDWEFLKLAPTMMADNNTDAAKGIPDLTKGLRTAASLAFKPFELYPSLKAGGIGLIAVVVALCGWALISNWRTTAPVAKYFSFAAVLIFFLAIFKEAFLVPRLKYRNTYLDIFIAIIMCAIGWTIFYPYLKMIDPLYVKWGSKYRK